MVARGEKRVEGGVFYSIFGFAQQRGQGWRDYLDQLAVRKHSQKPCEVRAVLP